MELLGNVDSWDMYDGCTIRSLSHVMYAIFRPPHSFLLSVHGPFHIGCDGGRFNFPLAPSARWEREKEKKKG